MTHRISWDASSALTTDSDNSSSGGLVLDFVGIGLISTPERLAGQLCAFALTQSAHGSNHEQSTLLLQQCLENVPPSNLRPSWNLTELRDAGEPFFSIPTTHSVELPVQLVDKIIDFKNLGRAWDGYQAEPITIETIVSTLEVLSLMSRSMGNWDAQSPEPFAAPAADGSVMLLWEFSEEDSFEVHITDGSILIVDESQGEITDRVVNSPSEIPNLLRSHVR